MTGRLVVIAMQARCPQWWSVFSVRAKTGTYEVYSDHVLRGTWRCGCRASIFGGRGARCKHIQRVLRNGCLAGPSRSAGRNDLGGRVSITNEPNPVPRATECTRRRCVCGEMMLAPLLRMDDGAGHQIVEVQFDGGGAQYAYAWGGQRALSIGERVPVAPLAGRRGTVVALASDYAGALRVIGENRRP